MPRDRELIVYFCEGLVEIVLRHQGSIDVHEMIEIVSQGLRHAWDRPPIDMKPFRAMPYGEYLWTDHWRKMREAALAWADHHCQICYERGTLFEVHHRTYERLGEERLSDLLVLCERCHEIFETVTTARRSGAAYPPHITEALLSWWIAWAGRKEIREHTEAPKAGPTG